VRWPTLVLVFTCAFAVFANAGSTKVLKVLPHYLDLKGRNSVHPSLFDRDAYQNELRSNPAKRSALRFDVQWKASGREELTLRIEAKGMRGKDPTKVTLEQAVKAGVFTKWSGVLLGGDDYRKFGELISWRATLLNGTNVIAEQKSFLW
jgi:hypothetical protein